MAPLSVFSRLVGLFFVSLCFTNFWKFASARSLLATSSGLADGASCRLSKDLDWDPPFCKGGPLNCVIESLPASNGKFLEGKCNSTVASFCSVGPYKFAVGVKGIPPYGPSSCEKCSCRLHAEIKGKNKAQCDCDKLPPCYLGSNGKVIGNGCPYEIQNQCVIVKPGGGKVVRGVRTDLGKCQAPQSGSCVSAGPNWGPLFYAYGANNVPFPGNLCFACTCKSNGQIAACKKIPGCTKL